MKIPDPTIPPITPDAAGAGCERKARPYSLGEERYIVAGDRMERFGLYFVSRMTEILDTRPHRPFPHPNLSDGVNHNIVQSEIEGGVYLWDLPDESTLEIETQNRSYTIVHYGEGQALISGHPRFCPQPVLVKIEGSNWGGSMLKPSYVGRGMHLEFRHPDYEKPIITSRILDIRQV